MADRSFTGALSEDEWREKRHRGVKERRKRLTAQPRDLRRLRKEGLVADALRPLVALAEEESADLVDMLGGIEEVSPAKRLLIEDIAYLGIAFRAEMGRYLATKAPHALKQAATLANTRRSHLLAVGLDRTEKPVVDAEAYLADKASP